MSGNLLPPSSEPLAAGIALALGIFFLWAGVLTLCSSECFWSPSFQPGTSEQPSSPCEPAANPLPTQSWPLRPSFGSMPPKLAGLARKNVELSFVRLITAEGGNREEGVWKEKRTRRRLGGEPESAVRASARPGCADIKERKVRKMGRAIKQKSKRRSRGGRIGGKASPDMRMGGRKMVGSKGVCQCST